MYHRGKKHMYTKKRKRPHVIKQGQALQYHQRTKGGNCAHTSSGITSHNKTYSAGKLASQYSSTDCPASLNIQHIDNASLSIQHSDKQASQYSWTDSSIPKHTTQWQASLHIQHSDITKHTWTEWHHQTPNIGWVTSPNTRHRLGDNHKHHTYNRHGLRDITKHHTYNRHEQRHPQTPYIQQYMLMTGRTALSWYSFASL